MWLIATSRNAILVILGGLIGYYFAADGSEPPFKIIGNFVNFHFFSVFCSFFLFICTLPCVYMLIIFSVFIYWYEFECFTRTFERPFHDGEEPLFCYLFRKMLGVDVIILTSKYNEVIFESMWGP